MTTIRPPRIPETETAAPGRASAAFRVGVRRVFGAEGPTYFLLLGTTLFLVVFGLVMVLSSSAVEDYAATGDFFGSFVRQGLFALIGVPLMLIAARLPVRFWRRWAWHVMIASILLQLLVVATPLGHNVQGNTNWIKVGSFTAQPSELIKLALVVWLGLVLAAKVDRLSSWRDLIMPVVPIAGGAILLMLVGNDLGTAVVLLLMVLGALFFAGVRTRHLAVIVVVVAIVGFLATSVSSSRSARIEAWLHGYQGSQYEAWAYQPMHALFALASGGVFGVGLGNSKMKWSWLPEADNDYIFAVIGEELGLIGAIVVLMLFAVLAIAFIRVIRRSDDAFVRIASSCVMVWVIGQAVINIAVVLGVLPVLGVPLPLISAGGSALISTLVAIGIVLSFARAQERRA